MISSVVVTYQVRPEAVEEHVRLIEAVISELTQDGPDTLEYKVMRLQDGVSFVHVATSDTPDGSSPLPGFASFQEFNRTLGERVTAPPVVTPATVVGAYQVDSPIGGAAERG